MTRPGPRSPRRVASRIARRLAAGGAALAGLAAACPPAGAADLVYDTAILQGLDKVTGRVMTIETPVGSSVHFGTLEIIVRTCRKRPPEDQPETAAFLDIWEIRTGEAATSLFRGWMFASSPALSALEHPVYDIWVLDCSDSNAKSPSTSVPTVPAPSAPASRTPAPPSATPSPAPAPAVPPSPRSP